MGLSRANTRSHSFGTMPAQPFIHQRFPQKEGENERTECLGIVLQNAKRRGIPSSCYALPVVHPSRGCGTTRGGRLCSRYVPGLSATGQRLSTWEGCAAWTESLQLQVGTEQRGSSACWLNRSVISRLGLFFPLSHPRTQRTVNIYSVVARTKVALHWFACDTDVKQRRWVTD